MVSTKRGFSAESPSASRRRLMAVLTPWSKSTNVSVGHSFCLKSSRGTTSPGRSSSIASTSKGCPWTLIFTPPLRSSLALRSASKVAKRTIRVRGLEAVAMTANTNRESNIAGPQTARFLFVQQKPNSRLRVPRSHAKKQHVQVKLTGVSRLGLCVRLVDKKDRRGSQYVSEQCGFGSRP